MKAVAALSVLVIGLVVPLASGQGQEEKSQERFTLRSKPVRVNDVDFEVMATNVWSRPPEVYGVAGTNIGLRISNRSDRDLTFDLGDALRIGLKSDKDKELVSGPVLKQFFPKPIKVAAGKTETLKLPAHLFHTRVREICLGLDRGAGYYWLTRDVAPGKYRLSLSYESKEKNNDAWQGKMQTESIEIEVVQGK